MTTLVVIAKQAVPGRVKTRLHPPFSLVQAAQLAAASLDDTLEAMRAVRADRRILLFQGDTAPVLARGYEIVPQSTGGLDERLATIFDAVDGPMLLVGMDTPQARAEHLTDVFPTWPDGLDACIGLATDGGWWALGMRDPRGDLIRGVPTSRDDTGALQLQRLHDASLRVGMLDELTDVDTAETADVVAGQAPGSRFAQTLHGIRSGLAA